MEESENEEFDETIKREDLPLELVKRPYQTIINWAESRFKKIGEKLFSFISLLPVSIMIPPIPYEDSFFRTNISLLFLSPPGSAKSMVSKVMEQICISPVFFKKISAAELETELSGKEDVTLIVDDSSRIFKDQDLIKVIEGVLSESRVSSRNKRERRDYEVIGNCYLAGTPQDLTHYISGGLLSRVCPIVILNTKDEQDSIGKDIVASIGNKSNHKITTKDVANYYKWIYQIQKGISPDFKPITGYYFPEEFKTKIYNFWKNVRDKIQLNNYDAFYRELISAFKYLCCSAVLNIANRNIRADGCIEPNEEDLKIALYLSYQELKTKAHILRNERMARKIKDVEFLEKVAVQHKMSKFNLDMIKILLQSKNT